MPNLQARSQSRSEELFEAPLRGPFGGIQSELPRGSIEPYGFFDIVNMMCRKGALTVRPGYQNLPQLPALQEPILGVVDFFDVNGQRHQMVNTRTRLLEWISGTNSWNVIAGTLTGGPLNLFASTANNYQLLFSQGVDKVQMFDGIIQSFAPVSPNAVAASYMTELNLSLVVAYTIEGGVKFPQRVRWTGPGDNTDWVSLNAGIQDLSGSLGPISGIKKIFQAGYVWHRFGITQMIPNGNGLKPFDFVPIASNNKGTFYPYSIAAEGGEFAAYVGIDNIYQFDGTQATPIGDAPIDGRRHLGARSRILAELAQVLPSTVYGYITTILGGYDYNAYWLNIPGFSTWVYNFDEQNWVRFTWGSPLVRQVVSMGRFVKSGGVTIAHLVGTIGQQNWSPFSLIGSNPLDGVLVNFTDATAGYFDFTTFSEANWTIQSGQLTFGDLRHQHNIKKFRLTLQDNGQVQFVMTVTGVVFPNPNPAFDNANQPITTNAAKVSQSKTITMGNGSGEEISRIIEFNVPGQYITWTIVNSPSWPTTAQPLSITEVTPIFDVGGEQRGG